jgi:hypothetical protein
MIILCRMKRPHEDGPPPQQQQRRNNRTYPLLPEHWPAVADHLCAHDPRGLVAWAQTQVCWYSYVCLNLRPLLLKAARPARALDWITEALQEHQPLPALAPRVRSEPPLYTRLFWGVVHWPALFAYMDDLTVLEQVHGPLQMSSLLARVRPWMRLALPVDPMVERLELALWALLVDDPARLPRLMQDMVLAAYLDWTEGAVRRRLWTTVMLLTRRWHRSVVLRSVFADCYCRENVMLPIVGGKKATLYTSVRQSKWSYDQRTVRAFCDVFAPSCPADWPRIRMFLDGYTRDAAHGLWPSADEFLAAVVASSPPVWATWLKADFVEAGKLLARAPWPSTGFVFLRTLQERTAAGVISPAAGAPWVTVTLVYATLQRPAAVLL